MKTKRLQIEPRTASEMENLIAETADEDLKAAYGEMLRGALEHPRDAFFYTAHKIILRDTGEHIGDVCFKGPPKGGAVEVGYGILPSFQGNGYMTEALDAVITGVFRKNGVFSVEAETAKDNEKSKRVLLKCGFMATGEIGEEGPRFAIQKPMVNYAVFFMFMGLGAGTALNSIFRFGILSNVFGMAIGYAFGTILCKLEIIKRNKITGKTPVKHA